jgi:hypothetical protein
MQTYAMHWGSTPSSYCLQVTRLERELAARRSAVAVAEQRALGAKEAERAAIAERNKAQRVSHVSFAEYY